MTHLGLQVTVCGWTATRRDHGGLIFIDLRDHTGLIQIIFDPTEAPHAHQLAQTLRSEFVVQCTGKIRQRPSGMLNPKLSTGAIEVLCTELKIFSESKTPPFPIEDNLEVNETLRFKYRYLDLRRPILQQNLKIRHRMLSIIRNYLDSQNFLEIETPLLYKSTPEGARDFLVPSRLNPSHFYALPQSPQILKQLLMIAGMDRYYQIARCFRDEDLRADRQPEFSQIDLEASFIEIDTLLPLIESMMVKLWKEILNLTVQTPFQRITYTEAMNRFGSDKPDIRFALEIKDISEIFKASPFQVFHSALTQSIRGQKGSIRALVIPKEAENFSRKDLDDLQIEANKLEAKGLLWIKIQEAKILQSPAAKFFSEIEKTRLIETLNLQSGDLVLIVADARNSIVLTALGAIRLILGKRLGLIPQLNQGPPHFLWVTHFPLLEFNDHEKRYYACHHPFTSPCPEYFEDFLQGKNLDQIQAATYDLVLNGCEIGGGSLRIYRPDLQLAMFQALGLSTQEAHNQFGFFIEALHYGAPPHGGIAIGVERLAAMLCSTGPIRDVMAFPKTQQGYCLMTHTPSKVSSHQLTEAGISTLLP